MPPNLPTLDIEAPSGGGDRSSQDNTFRFVLDVLGRHLVLVVASTVFVAILGAVGAFALREESFNYEAFADLTVTPSFWESPIMADIGGSVFGKRTPKALKERTSLRELAQDVARAVVQSDVHTIERWSTVTTEQEHDAVARQILSMLRLEDLNNGILRVRIRNDDEGDARRIAELASRVLVEYTRDQQRNEQQRAHALIREQLVEIRNQLEVAEGKEWDFREKMGFQTKGKVWQELESKNSELANTNALIEETQARLAEIEASLAENNRRLPDALGNVTDSVVRDLLSDLDELRRRHLELSVVWKDGYPELSAIEDEINEKKVAVLIAITELNDGAGGGSGLWGQRQRLYRSRVDLELDITTLNIRAGSLERRLREMVEQLPELADKSFEYERLTHEAGQIRKQFNLILGKEFEIKTAVNRGTATVERRDAVVVIPSFSGRRSPLGAGALMGALIGFIVGFSLAMMLELTDTSIKTIEDTNRYLGLEVIGMIPKMKFGRPKRGSRRRGAYVVSTDEEQVDACIVTQHDPKSPISEAYRSFRTNFQFATIQLNPKTIMVTSAVPGEGKTTTAVNLAVTMADRGMRVLIVDTDLRRPNVHKVLKIERGPGLADVLRERIPIRKVIRPTRVENLWIITSGRVPPNPSELIGSARMKRLMLELGQTFDLVICDAPSILVVTDPVLVATHVDSVILVVSVEYARRETIQRAVKLMETANPSIAGAVLNGLESSRRHYYYYYYYYDDRSRPGPRRWYHNI